MNFPKELKKIFFFVRGVPRGRAKNLFALILEIGPSNIIINIFTFIEFQTKNFFAMGVPGGGANFCFSFIIRDRTFKHKYQYFRLNKRYSKQIFFCQGRTGGEGENLYFLYY